MHVLLVEDDLELGAALQQALARSGVTSEWVRRAVDAQRFVHGGFDCVLLDLNLPDGHGLTLLQSWRQAGLQCALIVITASDALGERIAGLNGGADDFLVKPFAVSELVARLHAVTRRMAQQAASIWQVGALSIDMSRRECRVGDRSVALSPREFEIVAVLARSAGAVVPKHRLAQALSPLGDALDFNALEVHISNIRKKLGQGAIRTLRGVGYRLAGDDA